MPVMATILPFTIYVVGAPEELQPREVILPVGSQLCARLDIRRLEMAPLAEGISLPQEVTGPEGAATPLVLDLRPSGEQEADIQRLVDPARVLSGQAARTAFQLIQQMKDFCLEADIQSGIIETATDAIVTINENHQIIGYNRGAEQIFGYSRDEALGQDLSIIIPPPHKNNHKEYVRRYIATRTAHVIGKHVQLTAQRKNGEEFPMSISFSVAEIGGNLYFTGIVRDISEYVALEEQLRQSERLAAVGNIIEHVAHEIKNPLMIIGGFARQLLKAPVLDNKGRQKLTMITEEVARLEGMMLEMRDFSRPPPLNKKVAQIEQLLRDVEALYADTLQEHGITLRLTIPEPLPPCLVDRGQLKQVLVNLVKNASEAMPQGGEISLGARINGPHLEIEVRDTGEGMAPEVAENIFTPYYTTKSKGSGLGLAISRNIIKAHNGEIMVSSILGQGSNFLIQLPLEDLAIGACPL